MNGIAIANIIVNFVVLAIAIVFLKKESIAIFKKEKQSFKWMKEWFSVGKFSGIESFLRNFAFLLGISLMFGIGMTLDFISTMILYFRMLKKKGIKIDFRLNVEKISLDTTEVRL